MSVIYEYVSEVLDRGGGIVMAGDVIEYLEQSVQQMIEEGDELASEVAADASRIKREGWQLVYIEHSSMSETGYIISEFKQI